MTRKELVEELIGCVLTPVLFRDLNRELKAQYADTDPDSETVIGYYLPEGNWFVDD